MAAAPHRKRPRSDSEGDLRPPQRPAGTKFFVCDEHPGLDERPRTVSLAVGVHRGPWVALKASELQSHIHNSSLRNGSCKRMSNPLTKYTEAELFEHYNRRKARTSGTHRNVGSGAGALGDDGNWGGGMGDGDPTGNDDENAPPNASQNVDEEMPDINPQQDHQTRARDTLVEMLAAQLLPELDEEADDPAEDEEEGDAALSAPNHADVLDGHEEEGVWPIKSVQVGAQDTPMMEQLGVVDNRHKASQAFWTDLFGVLHRFVPGLFRQDGEYQLPKTGKTFKRHVKESGVHGAVKETRVSIGYAKYTALFLYLPLLLVAQVLILNYTVERWNFNYVESPTYGPFMSSEWARWTQGELNNRHQCGAHWGTAPCKFLGFTLFSDGTRISVGDKECHPIYASLANLEEDAQQEDKAKLLVGIIPALEESDCDVKLTDEQKSTAKSMLIVNCIAALLEDLYKQAGEHGAWFIQKNNSRVHLYPAVCSISSDLMELKSIKLLRKIMKSSGAAPCCTCDVPGAMLATIPPELSEDADDIDESFRAACKAHTLMRVPGNDEREAQAEAVAEGVRAASQAARQTGAVQRQCLSAVEEILRLAGDRTVSFRDIYADLATAQTLEKVDPPAAAQFLTSRSAITDVPGNVHPLGRFYKLLFLHPTFSLPAWDSLHGTIAGGIVSRCVNDCFRMCARIIRDYNARVRTYNKGKKSKKDKVPTIDVAQTLDAIIQRIKSLPHLMKRCGSLMRDGVIKLGKGNKMKLSSKRYREFVGVIGWVVEGLLPSREQVTLVGGASHSMRRNKTIKVRTGDKTTTKTVRTPVDGCWEDVAYFFTVSLPEWLRFLELKRFSKAQVVRFHNVTCRMRRGLVNLYDYAFATPKAHQSMHAPGQVVQSAAPVFTSTASWEKRHKACKLVYKHVAHGPNEARDILETENNRQMTVLYETPTAAAIRLEREERTQARSDAYAKQMDADISFEPVEFEGQSNWIKPADLQTMGPEVHAHHEKFRSFKKDLLTFLKETGVSFEEKNVRIRLHNQADLLAAPVVAANQWGPRGFKPTYDTVEVLSQEDNTFVRHYARVLHIFDVRYTPFQRDPHDLDRSRARGFRCAFIAWYDLRGNPPDPSNAFPDRVAPYGAVGLLEVKTTGVVYLGSVHRPVQLVPRYNSAGAIPGEYHVNHCFNLDCPPACLFCARYGDRRETCIARDHPEDLELDAQARAELTQQALAEAQRAEEEARALIDEQDVGESGDNQRWKQPAVEDQESVEDFEEWDADRNNTDDEEELGSDESGEE